MGLRTFAVVLTAILSACGASSSVADAAPVLGIASFTSGALNADGTPSTQAGAHPFELRTSFVFETVTDTRTGDIVPGGTLKDTTLELPPGVLGNPSSMAQCLPEQVELTGAALCPPASQIGIADIEVGWFFGRKVMNVPVYNMKPPPGEPAQFAFQVIAAIAHIDVKIRTNGDYGATTVVHNANASAPVYGVTVHLWGVPADPSHDASRYAAGSTEPGTSAGVARTPYLRNPTSCTGPLATTMIATSYQEPEQLVSTIANAPAITGCSRLPFAPTVSVAPDTKQAGSPTGLGVDVDVPQNEDPDGLSTAYVKRVVVNLPAGIAMNPSAADGLEGCSDSDFAIKSTAEDQCPTASKIGAVTITSPLLKDPLMGDVFLASPLEQGSAAAAAGRMFRLFLTARGSGVMVKLAGSLVPDPVTGQLTATFDNNPQLPFSNAHLQFVGGSRAPLSLPRACGVYTTHAELTSWSSNTTVSSDSSFVVGQGCDRAGRFESSLSAGLTNPVAGGFSGFTATLSRPDGQQDVSSLDLTLPPGLLANIAGVPLCAEAQAAAGSCSSASQIGRTTIAAGSGGTPLWVPEPGMTPTAVYLAGPYKGAPFSLSVVVPAQAGPFDIGTVVVRAALFVDKHDGHVSVVSDAIPTILDGIPLNVQTINVAVDRPGFMVAPTSCFATRITGTASSSAGAIAGLASRFQVGGCAALKFTPKFSAGITGLARSKGRGAGLFAPKANGVRLHVKLAYPTGSAGTQANIAKVKVELPKQIPSRLATLQKACTSAQFDANPAGCPAASIVGTAKVNTPLLPVPLTGPAYFVSHGGEAFPSLTMVLQGYGVTIELVGATFIEKAGITSTTFNIVPDVPFSSFELTLPQGKFSAVTGNGDLCKPRLVMPTDYVAQSGVRLHQSNRIAVTGCSTVKAHKAHKALKALKARKASRRR